MPFESDAVDTYLKMSGQTFQYLMSGAMQYGPGFIYELMLQAIRENKKIVWKTKLVNGNDFGLVSYRLVPIDHK